MQLELEATLGQEKEPKLWGFHLGGEIGLPLLRASLLFITMIYGINNKSLADVEGPGKEPACRHGGIVSLLRKKIKRCIISPSELSGFK